MSNLRKLIASVDSLNESTAKSTATPAVRPIVAGSMLKALNMITKSVAPKVALAREYKQFVNEAFEYPSSQIADPEERARIHELRALMGAFGNAQGLRRARHLYNKGMLKATPKETALLLKLTDESGTILPRSAPDFAETVGVATEAEGTPEGLPHLTKTMLRNIVQQIDTEGAQAIAKSLEWGDGAAEELLALIKQDLENHIDITESVKQRLDKSCWAGYRKAGTKIKGGVKVNNCVKESYGVFARTNESAPIRTFALKEDAVALARRYNKLNPAEGIKYVVRNVSEAMPPAVATASAKMNPGAQKATPTAATTAPGAPKAPGVAGAVTKVDPAAAAAQKTAVQQNLKTVAPGPAPASDMSMPAVDQAKLAGAMSPLLQDPAAAKELAALTNKYKTNPGIR